MVQKMKSEELNKAPKEKESLGTQCTTFYTTWCGTGAALHTRQGV